MKGSLQTVLNSRGERVWRAQWRENGRGRTRILGKVREMSRGEAWRVLAAIVEPLNNLGGPKAQAVSVAGFIRDEYLPSRSLVWKRSTELTTTSLLELHVIPAIGDRPLAAVQRRELQAMLTDLAASHSRSIVSHVRFQLRAIFALAMSDGRVLTNPGAELRIPRTAAGRKAPQIGDREAIGRAIMGLDLRDRLFLALAVWHGLRPGEVAALRVGDIDGAEVHIQRRIYRGVVDEPKSAKGVRSVPLGGLAGMLQEYVAGLEHNGPEAWLFPSENGQTPVSASNLYRRRLKPALEAAGLKGFNYQAMRATFATKLSEVVSDAKIRADIMGHDVSVHENTYRQTSKDQRRDAIRRLEEKIQ